MLTPEERAREEEKARIQTQAQYDKGMGFLKFQFKFVGFGCLGIALLFTLLALPHCGGSLS
ncbi:MAG TPA: hypothetical protein VGD66_04315 [Allosphingosinicella sp.]|jgi:hypothetical protein